MLEEEIIEVFKILEQVVETINQEWFHHHSHQLL